MNSRRGQILLKILESLVAFCELLCNFGYSVGILEEFDPTESCQVQLNPRKFSRIQLALENQSH